MRSPVKQHSLLCGRGTVLSIAANHNDTHVLELLIAGGADIHYKDICG